MSYLSYDSPADDSKTEAPEPPCPGGTADGPYALTPDMLKGIRNSDRSVRAVALSWALVGFSRNGSQEIGEHYAQKAVEHARRWERYICDGAR